MKKVLFPTTLALAILAGCVKENPSKNDPVFSQGHHAYIVQEDDAETRTDFDSFSGDFAWSQGDEIAIHYSDGTYRNATVDYKTGEFTSSSTSTVYRDGYAVYPASYVDQNYSDLYVYLPSEYDIKNRIATKSNYSPVPMIAVNTDEESDLYFRHLGGLLRITCNAVPAGTTRIAVSLDKNICGPFAVSSPASKTPSINAGDGYSNTVYFIVSEYGLSEKTDGIVLNLPVPVGTYNTLTVSPINYEWNTIGTTEREISLNVKREKGKKYRFSLTEPISDFMQLIVEAGNTTGYTYTLPFSRYDYYPADLEIEWGDGSTSSVSAGTYVDNAYSNITHDYSSPGEYTITITGSRESNGPLIPRLETWNTQGNADYGYDMMLKYIPTPFLRIDSVEEYNSFRNCLSLTGFCSDIFSKNPQLTRVSNTFHNCHLLQEVPSGLYDCLPNLQSIWGTFSMEELYYFEWNGITIQSNRLSAGIPSGLFDNLSQLTALEDVFAGCDGITSIPDGIFSNLSGIQSLAYMFKNCTGITGSIPSDIFAQNTQLTNLCGVFYGCTGLKGAIPSDLFEHNTLVTDLGQVFYNCEGLNESIPSDLFKYNPDVTSFNETFSGCINIPGEIPVSLFQYQTKVQNFAGVFQRCWSLEGYIPENLFETNSDVYSFYGAFQSCEKLEGSIPGGLFSHQRYVTDFGRVFEYCQLEGPIPENLFATNPNVTSFDGTFANNSRLNGSIPGNLFKNNTQVLNFGYVFGNCTGLTGEIPATLFAYSPMAYEFSYSFLGCNSLKPRSDMFGDSDRFAQMSNQVSFYGCFDDCGSAYAYGDGGTAPALWNFNYGNGVYYPGCFSNCKKLSNYDDIPEDWKSW